MTGSTHPRLLGSLRLALSIAILASSPAFAGELFVNDEDPACLGAEPCYSTIQEAVDRALPGDQVRIQPGVYAERLFIRDKNYARSTPGERIVIGRDDTAPVDSVVLDGTRLGGGCGVAAIEIVDSAAITLRGLVITGFAGPSIRLRGGPHDNRAIHLERNRIFDNGRGPCGGGVVIEKGNPDTLVLNNLIYANRGSGVELSSVPGRGRGVPEQARERLRNGRGSAQGLRAGGPHYLIQNTIHGNGTHGIAIAQGQRAILANNAVTGNGGRGRGGYGGYGVYRDDLHDPRGSEISLLNNLLCGNGAGEVDGPVFAGENVDNLTPTGAEAAGLEASPECLEPGGLYADVDGADDRAGTLDDDFGLTGPRDEGLPSPAIDRGIDPRTLGLDMTLDPLLLADYLAPDVRPVQRDANRPLDFDIGALELPPCECFENCEECEIVVREDGSSVDRCSRTYDRATECCNRITGEIGERELGHAYEVCPETRSPIPGFDEEGSSDGCSAVPDRPLLLCQDVRFGCDLDSGEENCPAGIQLPCNRHDYCYQTCGRTKSECDLQFNDDMIAMCNNMTAAQKLLCYDDCLLAVATYFDGVALVPAAEDAYVNGQNRGCQCCQDVFPVSTDP